MAGFKSMNLLTLWQWHAQKTGCTASIVILTDKAGVQKEAKLPPGISSSITTGCLLSQPMAAAALADSLATGSHKLITKTEREREKKKQQQKPYWWHHSLQSNSHIPSTHLVSPVQTQRIYDRPGKCFSIHVPIIRIMLFYQHHQFYYWV